MLNPRQSHSAQSRLSNPLPSTHHDTMALLPIDSAPRSLSISLSLYLTNVMFREFSASSFVRTSFFFVVSRWFARLPIFCQVSPSLSRMQVQYFVSLSSSSSPWNQHCTFMRVSHCESENLIVPTITCNDG
jgi:hypothetical protein